MKDIPQGHQALHILTAVLGRLNLGFFLLAINTYHYLKRKNTKQIPNAKCNPN